MRYLKRFNESKDVFLEYKLEWFENREPQEMIHDKLSKILRFVRMESIRDYTISGQTTTGEWKVILKIGK